MRVLSLVWVGTRTAEYPQTVAFFTDVLGLRVLGRPRPHPHQRQDSHIAPSVLGMCHGREGPFVM